MTYYYIYKITCTKGSFKDKFYFGQHATTNLDDGYKGSGVKINEYYKKYPEDYIKEIICFCNDADELNKKEYEIIHPWLNNEMCLNLIDGGYIRGYKHSEESKKKISEKTKEAMKHVQLWNKGKHNVYSKETLNSISNSLKGNTNHKGCKHSEETRKKISEARKGKPAWNKGKKASLETRKKLSESHKGYIATEETRKKLSEALKGKPCPIKGKHRVYREDGTFYMK